MPNYSPVIGKKLIKQLMFSLYADERVIFREYIQNASDSILRAVDQGFLEAAKDGYAQVTIKNKQKEITIRDNGAGIHSSIAEQTLLDISNSSSDGIAQAGQYGIGRLVGAGYCQKLTFKTSCKGEPVATIVTLDSVLADKIVRDNNDHSLASEVMAKISSVERIEEEVDEHYFEVKMEGVLDRYSSTLLSEESVKSYLIEVAPVDFDTSFKNTLIRRRDASTEHLELYESLRHIGVFVNKSRKLSKGYQTIVAGSNDEIDHLEYFTLDSDEYGRLGWGWIALTKFTVQIAPSDPMRGIRLRKHNIQIGGQNTLSARPTYWKEERGNSYFYGEIHATHPNIIPNAARDGLAPTKEAHEFNDLIREQFVLFKRLYEKANVAKNAVSHIKEATNKLEKEQKTTPIILDNFQAKGVDVFTRLQNQETSIFLKSMLELYNPLFDLAVSKYRELHAQLKSEEPSSTPSQQAPHTDNVEDTQKDYVQNPAKAPGIIKSPTTQNTTVSKPSSGNPGTLSSTSPQVSVPNLDVKEPEFTDLLSPLYDKYSKSELMLIRKIFGMMTLACPPNMKMTFEQMKRLAISKLLKP